MVTVTEFSLVSTTDQLIWAEGEGRLEQQD